MTIYIVTHSDAYYPLPGAGDWELVTRDLAGAEERARGLAGDCYSSAYLLAVDEDSLLVRELPDGGGKR